MSTAVTTKQQAVLDFVKDYMDVHGVSPSVAEIREEFKWSSNRSVRSKLLSLELKGKITRVAGQHRNIRVR